MPKTDFTLQLNSFKSLISELQSRVTPEDPPVLDFLPHINTLLERAVSVCRAATDTEISDAKQPLIKKEAIAPGEKKELQWRFKPTAKPPGRKKGGQVLKYENNP